MDTEQIAGGAAIGGVVTWLVQRLLGSPDKVAALTDRVTRLEAIVNGESNGLVTVVGRLAGAVERLDRLVERIDARLEASDR